MVATDAALDHQLADLLREIFKLELRYGCVKDVRWDFVRALVTHKCQANDLRYILGRCALSKTGLHLFRPNSPRVFHHVEGSEALWEALMVDLERFTGGLPKEVVGVLVRSDEATGLLTFKGIVQPVVPYAKHLSVRTGT